MSAKRSDLARRGAPPPERRTIMGRFDWRGPLNAGRKARGWDALPQLPAERKSSWIIDDYRAVVVSPLVHGPGASDQANWRRGDGNSAVFACLQALATA